MYRVNTPLRYPGGKQRITPFIQELLNENEIDGNYVEPYAGGAGVAINLLLAKKVKNIYLNDSDRGIYAFWYSVINETEKLCGLISDTEITIDEWKYRKSLIKQNSEVDLLELGFSIFFLNRCNRSGILSAGVIGGIEQAGDYKIDARFHKDDLVSKIEAIAEYRQNIFITNLDAEYYIKNYITELSDDTLIYLDPPYYEKSSELYLNSYLKSDHGNIANVIQNDINHKWVLSYDGVPEILKLYESRRSFIYDLSYSAGKSYKGKEVFVFCDDLILPISCTLENVNAGLAIL